MKKTSRNLPKNKIQKFVLLFIFLLMPFFFPKMTYAVGYTLSLPSGPFTRDQNIQVTVNIDTQGSTLTSAETTVNYLTQYLQYVSTAAGGFFPNISAVAAGGTLRITGSVNAGDAGKTGTGVFAYITFKLVADSPGSADFCTIVTPTPTTPLVQPTAVICEPTTVPGQPTTFSPVCEITPPVVTSPPGVTSPPVVTSQPVTSLPRSGYVENILIVFIVGVILSSTGVILKKITL